MKYTVEQIMPPTINVTLGAAEHEFSTSFLASFNDRRSTEISLTEEYIKDSKQFLADNKSEIEDMYGFYGNFLISIFEFVYPIKFKRAVASLNNPLFLLILWIFLEATNNFYKELSDDELNELNTCSDYTVGVPDIPEMVTFFSNALLNTMPVDDFIKIVNVIEEYPCLEDINEFDELRRTDFIRQWYHTRTLHPQVSLDELQAQYEQNHDSTVFGVIGSGLSFTDRIESKMFVDKFFDSLDSESAAIVRLRMKECNAEDIAERLGISSRSKVYRKLKEIQQKFEKYAGEGYVKSMVKKPAVKTFKKNNKKCEQSA